MLYSHKMVDVTITGNDGSIFTFAAGEVKDVDGQVIADIEISEFPGTGPSESFGFDFNGVRKVITLTGHIFETTTSRVNTESVTTVLEQKQWLEKQLNGQQSGRTFTSNYESQTFDGTSYVPTKIFAGQAIFKEIAGDPERLQFTINLLVGS